MLSGRELALGIVGAWRLVRADRTALLCFDLSPRGFWRSFWVMAIVAPAQALLVVINLSSIGIDAITPQIVLLGLGFYALDWLMLPAFLGEIALRGQRVPQFAAYVIANNYAQIVLGALLLTCAAIGMMVTLDTRVAISLAALAMQGIYQYRVARIAFDLEPVPAVALSIVTIIFSIMLWSTFQAAAMATLPPSLAIPPSLLGSGT